VGSRLAHIPSTPKRVVGTLTPTATKSKLGLLQVARSIFEGRAPALMAHGTSPALAQKYLPETQRSDAAKSKMPPSLLQFRVP
jgi:hypothetical protein